ncbi:MAG: 5'-methylthioadenosine/adenosylhomocysteine nucleosidase [Firmicutes bacterium]|nr:5'-methylthioadenosine/adenosylhomocysteine nucleosidase [Bacillota bacterium]
MEKPIAIIGAMDEEVEELSQGLTPVPQFESQFLDMPVFQGSLGNRDVVVVRCGIGKVNAAIATQYVIDRFRPAYIINSGIAGGISPNVRIADLVLGTHSAQHDFDVRKFGYARGVIPRLAESTFKADSHLLQLALMAAQKEIQADRLHQGLIVSGDQFISSREQKQEIRDFFPQALCAEMEGAAIAQVAAANRIPHLIVRAISDLADGSAPEDFERYLSEIIPVLNAVIQGLLSLIKD